MGRATDHDLTAVTMELFRVATALAAELQADTGLAYADVRGLRALDHLREAPLPVGVLGERLGLSSAATSGLVDRLERAGLAERAVDGGDRRRVLVQLAPRARNFGVTRLRPLAQRMREAATALDDRDRQVVQAYLSTVLGVGTGLDGGHGS